jgi:hypothetical protein
MTLIHCSPLSTTFYYYALASKLMMLSTDVLMLLSESTSLSQNVNFAYKFKSGPRLEMVLILSLGATSAVAWSVCYFVEQKLQLSCSFRYDPSLRSHCYEFSHILLNMMCSIGVTSHKKL